MSDTKDPDKPEGFPDIFDLMKFDKGRSDGSITVFRARRCDVCQRVIPKAFKVCSAECFDKLPVSKEGTA